MGIGRGSEYRGSQSVGEGSFWYEPLRSGSPGGPQMGVSSGAAKLHDCPPRIGIGTTGRSTLAGPTGLPDGGFHWLPGSPPGSSAVSRTTGQGTRIEAAFPRANSQKNQHSD